jgi:hypothetical protein
MDQTDPGGPVAAFVDILTTGVGQVVGGSTNGAATITLSQPFPIYGVPFSQVNVSTNGYITTELSDDGRDLTNDCPLPATPDHPVGTTGARIYPLHGFFTTLPVPTGGIFLQYFATSPVPNILGAFEPCSLIMWSHMSGLFNAEDFDFEVILFHETGEIRFQYRDLDVDGSFQSIGIQDFAPPSTGLTYLCHVPLPTNATVVSFVFGRIRVLRPNGDDLWTTGTTRRIRWISEGNVGPKVRIDLYKNDQFVQRISRRTANDGVFAWDIPKSLQRGGGYRVKILSKTTLAKGISDGTFFIRH